MISVTDQAFLIKHQVQSFYTMRVRAHFSRLLIPAKGGSLIPNIKNYDGYYHFNVFGNMYKVDIYIGNYLDIYDINALNNMDEVVKEILHQCNINARVINILHIKSYIPLPDHYISLPNLISTKKGYMLKLGSKTAYFTDLCQISSYTTLDTIAIVQYLYSHTTLPMILKKFI